MRTAGDPPDRHWRSSSHRWQLSVGPCSAARTELRDVSDVDLLVEFQPDRTPGLLGIARLELALPELLGREVDLRAAGDLSPYFS